MKDRDPLQAVPLLENYISDARSINYGQEIFSGLHQLGRVQTELMNLEAADSIYYIAIQEAYGNPKKIGLIYKRMAYVSKQRGEPYKGIARLEKSLEYYHTAMDSSSICKQYIHLGNRLSYIDEIDLAMDTYEKGLAICEAIGNMKCVALSLENIGITYAKIEQWALADSAFIAAISKINTAEGDITSLAISMSNRALLKMKQGKDQEALDLYNEVIGLGIKESILGVVLDNRAEVYNKRGNYMLAYTDAQESIVISSKYNDWLMMASSKNTLAKALLGLGRHQEALRILKEGALAAKKSGSLDELKENYKILTEIYAALGDLNNVLVAQKEYDILKDSIFSKSNAAKIKRVEQKYTASLTHAENKLLKTELDLSYTKRTRLFIALICLGLIGALGVWSLLYKRKQDERIFHTEQDLQNQLIKNQQLKTEQLQSDLTIKKQELLANALQIQNKNKVLTTVNDQISDIKPNMAGAQEAIAKISRQISIDLESYGEWDNFLQSFSEIHVDFINRLNREHADLSRHQLRLICLMKMNLSSREIGDIFNISSEGVKKARYRVKKKLGLSTDQKIEDFLNDFVGNKVAG